MLLTCACALVKKEPKVKAESRAKVKAEPSAKAKEEPKAKVEPSAKVKMEPPRLADGSAALDVDAIDTLKQEIYYPVLRINSLIVAILV